MWTELHCLCEKLNVDDILSRCKSHPEELMERDDHNLTPLHILCLAPVIPFDVIHHMIEVNPTILKERDTHGETPLHICLRNRNVDINIVRLLIENCPEALEVTNKEGMMPLHVALRYNSKHTKAKDLIVLLVKSYPLALAHHVKMGYSSVVKDFLCHEPSHFIADPKFSRCINEIELKYHDADIQIRDGAYPIHIALHEGAPYDVLEVLVAENPDSKTYADKFGLKALDIAKERHLEQETLDLLTIN
jgi:ankyrin repeat protein